MPAPWLIAVPFDGAKFGSRYGLDPLARPRDFFITMSGGQQFLNLRAGVTIPDDPPIFDAPDAPAVVLRNLASDEVDNSRAPDAKRDRAVADVIINEINVLRGIVIGADSLVFDPANMPNATGLTSANITVTGAAFGDFVDVAAPYSLQGIIATAYVSAVNTVVIRLHNGTGGAVNLASGTWNVIVRRQGVLAPRTLAQAKTAIKNSINAGTVD